MLLSALKIGSRKLMPLGSVIRMSASKKKKKTMGTMTALAMGGAQLWRPRNLR
jgi:hypothetical protein